MLLALLGFSGRALDFLNNELTFPFVARVQLPSCVKTASRTPDKSPASTVSEKKKAIRFRSESSNATSTHQLLVARTHRRPVNLLLVRFHRRSFLRRPVRTQTFVRWRLVLDARLVHAHLWRVGWVREYGQQGDGTGVGRWGVPLHGEQSGCIVSERQQAVCHRKMPVTGSTKNYTDPMNAVPRPPTRSP